MSSEGIKPGYKRTEVGVIPVDWAVHRIYDVADNKKARFDDGDWVEAEHITDKGIRLIQTGNIGIGCFIEKDVKKYIYKTSFDKLKCKELFVGDLLICRLAEPAGRACLLPELDEEKVITSVDVTIFRPKPEDYDRGYLVQYLSTPEWFFSVNEQVGGTTHKRIARGALGKISIPIPASLNEQRAIATALSDVDALLNKLDQLIAKKRDLKQATMQQLLTGQTRLPGFSGDWEVKRLGEITSLIPGGVYGAENPNAYLIPYRVATTAHIDMSDTWNDKEMNIRHFTKDQVDRYLPQEGDLIIVKSSGTAASIQSGKIGFVDESLSGRFIFSNFLMLLRPTRIVPRFLYYYLCSHNVKKLLPSLVEASTYPNIRIYEYLALEIPLTCPKEQTAIATVLSDMDAELAALEARRDKTRALKQGMMQELLTGRIRLV